MTRLFILLGLHRAAPDRGATVDGPETEPAVHSDWFESSHELRRGLVVLEDDERDSGPETRPFTYQVEAA